MKKIIPLFLILGVASALNASDLKTKKKVKKEDSGEKCYNESTHLLGVGGGFGGYSTLDHSGGSYSRTPTVFVNYEQPWKQKIGPGFLGVGAYLGFQHARYLYRDHGSTYYFQYDYNHYLVMARATYHWDVLNFKNAEVYGGVLVGVRFQTFNFESNYPANFPGANAFGNQIAYPSYAVFVGARWYFVPKVALFAEVGPGNSFVTGGVNFKF